MIYRRIGRNDIQIQPALSILHPSQSRQSPIELNQIIAALKGNAGPKEAQRRVTMETRPIDLRKLRLPPDRVHHWKQFKFPVIRNGVLHSKVDQK